MTPAAPLVCKPLGTLALAEVPAFPPAAARALEQAHAVRTLSDLQPHVEAQGGDVDAVRKAFIMLDVRKEHLDQATWSLLRHLNPDTVPEIAKPKKEKKPRAKKPELTPEQAAAIAKFCPKCTLTDHGEGLTPAGPTDGTSAPASPSPTAPQCITPVQTAPADDFDAETPPPRSRPIGQPVPRFVRVTPGDSVVQIYLDWDKNGRIPAGSVLLERLWSDFGRLDPYRVAASRWPPPLGEPGESLSEAKLAGWVARVVIEQKGKPQHVVMSREGA